MLSKKFTYELHNILHVITFISIPIYSIYLVVCALWCTEFKISIFTHTVSNHTEHSNGKTISTDIDVFISTRKGNRTIRYNIDLQSKLYTVLEQKATYRYALTTRITFGHLRLSEVGVWNKKSEISQPSAFGALPHHALPIAPRGFYSLSLVKYQSRATCVLIMS